jgi:hypothetical protein
MRRFTLLLGCLALIGSSACDRRKGPSKNMEAAQDWGGNSDDPHAQVAPQDNPHGGVDMGGGGAAEGDDQPDPHAGMDMAPPADRQIDATKFLKGTIVLPDDLKDKVPPGAVIFIFAKAPSGGPPLAVERDDVTGFPMTFDLDENDQMMAGTSFSGAVTITVHVDQDSDVSSKQPGDLYGQVQATIPADGLQITLSATPPS